MSRALDGQDLTTLLVNGTLPSSTADGIGRRVKSIEVERGSTRKGKHAHVATLLVELDGVSDGSKARVFIKRSVRTELPARSEAHWTRDLASYRNEARFYAHLHPLLLEYVPMIQVFAVDQHASVEGGEDDSFLMLMQDASPTEDINGSTRGFESRDMLGTMDTRGALEYLASLHAAGLSRSGENPILNATKESLWMPGGWWTLDKRGIAELNQALSIWPRVLDAFENQLTAGGVDPQDPQIVGLAARFVRNAQFISDELSATGHNMETIVHGDFKSANLFFRTQAHDAVAFDWQWTGAGLGAYDVAYLFSTSVGMEAFSICSNNEHAGVEEDPYAAALDYGETELLAFYYNHFVAAARLQGVEASEQYSFGAFRRHYVLATLDYSRLLISNFWKGMTPESCAAKATRTNCGLGYRSVAHVVRMVRRMHSALLIVDDERSLKSTTS